jgi:Tfp pilus assembly protein PilV
VLIRLRQGELGLTLIETLASILIFSIMTLGVAPLLLGSLRGTAVSRSYTQGKNLSNRTLERARALPFFQSVRNQSPPVRRDVLDVYFPSLDTTDGYTPAAIAATSTTPARPAYSFMTTCTGTVTAGSRGAAACPSNLSAGYRATVIARFVTPLAGSSPQTYSTAIPAAGYNWTDVSTEAPPTTLLELSITSSWTLGTPRTYNLTSFVGDRRLSPELYSANARLNYVVRAVASYVGTVDPNVGVRSQLEAVAGTAESSISNRASSRADEVVTGGRITLTREQGSGTDDPILTQVAGAPVTLAAPPTATTPDVAFSGGFSATSDGPGEVIHPHLSSSFGTIAYLDDHVVEGANTTAAVSSSGAPSARGRLSYTGISGLDGASALFVNNQIERAAVQGQATQLQLDRTKNVMAVERQLSSAINGCTAASGVSGPTAAGSTSPTCSFSNSANAVGARVGARLGKLLLFPVTFIPATNPDTSVLVLENFTMSVTCGSTSAPGSATVLGSWTATLKVWRDLTADDLLNGGYESFTIGGQIGTPATTTQFGNIGNPLVYDPVGTANDVYLLQGGGRKGYLSEGGLTAPALLASSFNPATRTAQVNANSPAIQIVTVPTDPAKPETSLTVDVGSMSCATVDKRGL